MSRALIIVDPQNDFCQGGSLQVAKSNQIFGPIEQLRNNFKFDCIFITMDWHPQNHISFAKNHGLNPFTPKLINGKQQILWPVHCVQNSKGAQISRLLKLNGDQIYVKKGLRYDEQQYSGFGTEQHPTELIKLLKDLNVKEVYIVGLAIDYCVGKTALDANKQGLNVTVFKQCTRGVSAQTSKMMIKRFEQNSILYKSYQDLIDQKKQSK